MTAMIARFAFEVEVLSPVHIGTGRELGNYDLAVIDGRLWRFDPERVATNLAADPHLLDRYIDEGTAALAGWPEEARRACARYALPWAGPAPRAVREHVADPLGRLYLPGSALKGAIRTALLWAYHAGLNEEAKARQRALIGQEPRREVAGRKWEQRVFGKDPNHDLLRALRVIDSTPLPAAVAHVVEIRIAVQEPNGDLTWFIRPQQHTSDPDQAIVLWAEAIPPGQRLRLVVEVDRFLTENATEGEAEAPTRPAQALEFDRRRRRLERWIPRCNYAAEGRAIAEQQWAEALGFEALANFYRRLRAEMARAPEAAYLQLGWGVGWRGKTAVEPLGPEAVAEARRRYGLGRRGDPFPKTRRVVFRNGQPWAPLGWVRLWPIPSP